MTNIANNNNYNYGFLQFIDVKKSYEIKERDIVLVSILGEELIRIPCATFLE